MKDSERKRFVEEVLKLFRRDSLYRDSRTTSAGRDYFPNNKIVFEEAALLAKEGPRELSLAWRVATAPENEIRGVVPEASTFIESLFCDSTW